MLSRDEFHRSFGLRPLFAMVHLLPLPGSPLYGGSIAEVVDRAVEDALAIEKGGAAGIVVENFGDRPFRRGEVDPETVAAMTLLSVEIRRAVSLPLGINVLRNDGKAALAIALATSASFIRVNVLVGAMLADQGIIEGKADELLRGRARLGATGISIFADHLVKHAVPLAPVDPTRMAHDLRHRGLADALIVTGSETGSAPAPDHVEVVRRATDAPLLLGSGLELENSKVYIDLVDGAIIGTSIKENGDATGRVSSERLARMVDSFSR